MSIVAIIVAAGTGSRFASETRINGLVNTMPPSATGDARALPKQYHPIAGIPMLAHSINRMLAVPSVTAVAVVIPPNDDDFEAQINPHLALHKPLMVWRCGGQCRAQSVSQGLAILQQQTMISATWALVHDAARPCVRPATVEAMIDALTHHPLGGILAVPLSDTLKQSAPLSVGARTSAIVGTTPRDHLWIAQTPQMFRVDPLREALQRAENAQQLELMTDEAMVLEAFLPELASMHPPQLFRGNRDNIKITYHEDLALAEAILNCSLHEKMHS
jgi:2-C-methyl-D-erythritol 4-phosphate cytidylyltransferase